MERKVVFITGGSAGIGLATVEILLKKGCIVYAGSRNPLKEASFDSANLKAIEVDVNNVEQVRKAVETIVSTEGKLDTVICNAGFGIAGAVEDYTIEEVRSQFNTNYFGVVNTIQSCLPQFRKQKSGRIITVSSVAGVIPIPYQVHYSAVKASVLMLMKGLAMEVEDYGIQCCSILPGDTKTNFTKARIFAQKASQESVYYSNMKRAVGKMEKDEENGKPASFVAKSIVKQVFANKMKTEVVPGIDYTILTKLGKFLPIRLIQFILKKMY